MSGGLVWSKVLTRSDAQRCPGSNQTGGVRLTRAGAGIDHTTYFRHQLFATYPWTVRLVGTYAEHAEVPFAVTVLGEYQGVLKLALSYRPQSEAKQRNYTTTMHLGRELRGLFRRHDLTGCVFSISRKGEDFSLIIERPGNGTE